MFNKKESLVRYLITILLLTIVFTSIPFFNAEPAEAADTKNLVSTRYTAEWGEIPQINISGANIDRINKEIWNKF